MDEMSFLFTLDNVTVTQYYQGIQKGIKMSRSYGFEDGTVRITEADGEKTAIFDVSRTVECLWIAVANREWDVLKELGSTSEMLEFVAYKQINGAEVVGDGGFLDHQANNDGFESWAEYVNDKRGEWKENAAI